MRGTPTMSESLVQLEKEELDFSRQEVRKAIREMVQSKAIASFPRQFQRLLEIAESDDERSALTAIRLLAQLSGVLVNKSQMEVKLTFDDLRKKQTSDDPLSSLFDIRSPILEGEIEEE
jgi:hypothetical protein